MLLLARRQAEGERCRALMEILNLGYKPLRNQIKKLNAFSGDNFSAALVDNSDMAENLSRMMVQMAIAEDLGIPVLHDYLFYIVLQMLLIYEEEMMSPPAGPACTREGERCYGSCKRRILTWSPTMPVFIWRGARLWSGGRPGHTGRPGRGEKRGARGSRERYGSMGGRERYGKRGDRQDRFRTGLSSSRREMGDCFTA